MDQPTNISTVSLVESNPCPNGMQLVNSYLTNKTSDPSDLVALAKQVQTADQFIRANAHNKLNVIADQIKYLQEQAKQTLIAAKRDADLHHAACNMVKKPGTMYYMYERESGQKYLSILSPEEWGASCPHSFCGAFKLEFDMSWTPIEKIQKRTDEIALMDKILNAQLAITDASFEMTGDFKVNKPLTVEEVEDSSAPNGK